MVTKMRQTLILIVVLSIVVPLGAHVASALKGHADAYVEAITQSNPRR